MTQNIVHQLGIEVLNQPTSIAEVHQLAAEVFVKPETEGFFEQVGIEVFMEYLGPPPNPLRHCYARIQS